MTDVLINLGVMFGFLAMGVAFPQVIIIFIDDTDPGDFVKRLYAYVQRYSL